MYEDKLKVVFEKEFIALKDRIDSFLGNLYHHHQ